MLLCTGCGISIESSGYRIVAGQPWHFECDGDELRRAVEYFVRVAKDVPDILDWAVHRPEFFDIQKARQWDEQRHILQEAFSVLEKFCV